MATGYEDWVKYRLTNPALALDRLGCHVAALQEILAGGRVQADGVSYDPARLTELLAPNGMLMRELNRLAGVVHRIGIPRFVPTRRVDGGRVTSPDGGGPS